MKSLIESLIMLAIAIAIVIVKAVWNDQRLLLLGM
jgi:hypothetical protein